MHENGRVLRIADFIRDELAVIIQQEMRDPRVGMVSVNEVSVSKDLSWADVYVSSIDSATLDERIELIAVLNKASGYFRSELAKRTPCGRRQNPDFTMMKSWRKGRVWRR